MGQAYECVEEVGCSQAVTSDIVFVIPIQRSDGIWLKRNLWRGEKEAVPAFYERPAKAALARYVWAMENDE